MSDGKPPFNLDAERSVLGAMIWKPTVAFEVIDAMDAEDFFLPVHKVLFEVVCELVSSGAPIDPVSVANLLDRRGRFGLEHGAHAYCLHIAGDLGELASLNVMHWVLIVRDKARKRAAIAICADVQARAYGDAESDDALLADFESQVFALNKTRGVRHFFANDVQESMDRAERRGVNPREIPGIPCGISTLDKITRGAEAPHLIVVAGRPGVGKSAFLFGNCATYAAVVLKIPTLILSLEMSRAEVTDRMLAGLARVDGGRFREGKLHKDEWRDGIYPAAKRLRDAPIELVDIGQQSIAQLSATMRRFRADERYFPPGAVDANGEPLRGLVIFDYVQLAKGSGNKNITRDQEIGEITGGLKAVAKATHLPIIAGAQLSRAVTKRENKKPMLADLRESGNIEQDADVVVFIHRESAYMNDDHRARAMESDLDLPLLDDTEFILAKHRHSMANISAQAKWVSRLTRFEAVETHPGFVQDPEAEDRRYR